MEANYGMLSCLWNLEGQLDHELFIWQPSMGTWSKNERLVTCSTLDDIYIILHLFNHPYYDLERVFHHSTFRAIDFRAERKMGGTKQRPWLFQLSLEAQTVDFVQEFSAFGIKCDFCSASFSHLDIAGQCTINNPIIVSQGKIVGQSWGWFPPTSNNFCGGGLVRSLYILQTLI